MRRSCVLLLCAALAVLVAGCSFATGSGNESRRDLTGVWIGNLTVDHVHGQVGFVRQDISFTLLQQQFAISGFYRCWSGDDPCADFNLGGRVARVRMGSQALAMRVRMGDGSSCFFQGVLRSDDMKGSCTCFTTRGAREKGWWHVQRAY
jgi:hypothetical protein